LKTTHKITVWFSGACLMIVLVSLFSFYTFRQIDEADAWRKHTHAVSGMAGKLLFDLKDAETNQRDYLLTGDEASLGRYLEAQNIIDEDLVNLRRISADNPTQQHSLDAIVPLVEARLFLLKQIIELRHNQNIATIIEIVRSGQGRELMQTISTELTGFIKIEEVLWEQHNARFELNMRRLLILIIVGSLLVVLFTLLSSYLLNREARWRIEIQIEMNKELDQRVQERTNELSVAMQSLSNSEVQLHTTIENLTEGVVVFDLDGQLLHCNRAALDLYGFATLDECRQHLTKFADTFELSAMDGTVWPVDQWPLARILRDENLRDLEVRIRHIQASWQRIFSYGGILVHNAGGQPLMAVVTISDITERKQAEEYLRASEKRLQLAATAGGVGIWDWDVVKDELIWDDSMYSLYGLDKKDFGNAYHAWSSTLHPDDREFTEGEIQAALRGEREYAPEFRIVRPNGVVRMIKATSQTIYDQDGKVLRMIGTNIDITERKQAEMDIRKLNAELEQRVRDRTEELNRANAELIYANRAKDSFLATMSHEIRTPLSGMLGMLELLSLTQLNSEQKKTLQAARESGNSLLRILSDILDWSKIEAGKLGLSPQATSLKLLLQEVVTTYSHVASAKGLALRQHVDVRLSPAHFVDSLRLSQILNNFVSNAIKFTKKGEVEVRADLLERSDGAEQVRFSVRDTGIGIDQEQQSSLFRDYTQATASTARMYGGTGLGLAISRRLLDLMQGQIDLVSTPGRGSTFSITLTLPVTEMEPEQSADAMANLSVHPIVQVGANALTVLVVDDHPINLALLARQVEVRGLRARRAEDGEAARTLWREGGISLVITDLHMPKMDGYELTAAIRSIEIAEARPRMPIIANTANALSEENERCHAAGMDEVMVKPATLAKLRATLLHWLPELSDIAAATPVHEVDRMYQVALEDADAPIDYAELRNIVPDRAGQIALLSNFQVHQHTDLDKLMEELDKGDLAGTALTAHRIKGASRMVGAKVLASAYAAIEQAAKQNDLEGARAAMHTLSAAVDRFEMYLLEQTDTKGENL